MNDASLGPSNVPPQPVYEWDAARNDYVLTSAQLPPEIQAELDAVEDSRELSAAEFEEVIDARECAEGLAQISEWLSELFTVKAARIDPDNPRYTKAVRVTYDRVVHDPSSRFLKLFRNRDLIFIGTVGAFAVPYVAGIAQEVRAKKRAKVMARGEGGNFPPPPSQEPIINDNGENQHDQS